MTRMFRLYAVLALLCFPVVAVTSCAKAPPNLDPKAVAVWNANEVLVALGTLQHTAIELSKVQTCPTPTTCRPVLSIANKNIVVDAVVDTLKVMGPTPPVSVQGTIQRALDVIESRLDAAGKQTLVPYIQAVKLVAGLIPALRTGVSDGKFDLRARQGADTDRVEVYRRLAGS